MPIDVDVTGGVSDSGAPPCKQARKKKSSVSPGEIPKQAIKSQDEKMASGVKLQDRRIMKKNRSQPASSSDEDDEDEDDEDDIEDLTDAQGQLISNVKKVRK
uniref:Uncharacterized protein n=1 Tax=Megaselia scalaris TaxID=36166 RepID=T1GBB0_MEGSC